MFTSRDEFTIVSHDGKNPRGIQVLEDPPGTEMSEHQSAFVEQRETVYNGPVTKYEISDDLSEESSDRENDRSMIIRHNTTKGSTKKPIKTSSRNLGREVGKDSRFSESRLRFHRGRELQAYEDKLHEIALQCGRCSDVLYANFRFDEVCQSLEIFKSKGLTLSKLLAFQSKIPSIYPWNTEYDDLRQDVNRRFNVFPLIIVMAKTKQDVITAFKFARRYNIDVCPRSGSHSAEGWSLCDGMIIDQSQRIKVCLDVKDKRGVFESGCLLGPIIDLLSPYHLTMAPGTCSNNSVTGYTLGGGIGFYSRKFGINCDLLTEVEILLADGRLVKANNKENSDLLWACQGGGGGNFGIVTDFTFKLYPVKYVYTLEIKYPFSAFKEVLKVWQNWCHTVDEGLTTEFRCRSGSASSGSPFIVSGIFIPSCNKARRRLMELIEPLLIGDNVKPIIQKKSLADAARQFAGVGRWLPFFKVKNSFITDPFPDEAIDIIIKYMSLGDGEDVFELNAMGGAINNLKPDETAFPHREGVLFWMLLNAHWNKQTQDAEKIKWVTDFYNELLPYLPGALVAPHGGRAYVNMPDIAIPDYLHQYYRSNLDRLIKIKRKYDPGNVFHYPQSIPVFPITELDR